MSDYLKLAREVADIARLAGKAIMAIYDSGHDLGIEAKADDSPLTLADRAANDIIVQGLAGLEFQAPIISEENKQIPFEQRKDYVQFWLVDPLDGTKEFIKRNGEFTVNIALIEQGKPILGVVYVPAQERMFYAVKGDGAYQYIGEEEVPLQVAQFKMADPGLRVVASRSHLSPDTQAYVDALVDPELVRVGSSLKIIQLAEGKAHLYPRLGPTMEWDIAAAQIILEEAGGKILIDGTEDGLTYNKENLRNPFFIAYGHLLPN